MDEHLRELVEIARTADPEAVEAARDRVAPQDLPALAQAYWSLPTWSHKAALIQLVQDHFSTATLPILWDFLYAPGLIGDDEIDLGKAIAICHFKRDFSIFPDYYADRHMLHQHVLEILGDEKRFKPKGLPEGYRDHEAETQPHNTDLIGWIRRLLKI